jgi:predicted ATPase/DNA-binding SARP family transcriptional activator/class 3 adenylate cyclase
MDRLAISLLGPFQVTLNGEPVTRFGSDTARALLAYLAMHPGVAHRRDALAGLLWPEQPDAEALRNLRVALSRLREAIGDRETDVPLLQVTRRTIQLADDARWSLDVWAMRDALTATREHDHAQIEGCGACAKRLQELVDLYRGEFLAGFTLDSAPFEEWLVVEREGLHLQALEALRALASYHETQGDYESAIACARRQVELEPWREVAHRQWMRALALSGHRGAALAQYDACQRVLLDELGVQPEPATIELYEDIRSGKLAAARDISIPAVVETPPDDRVPTPSDVSTAPRAARAGPPAPAVDVSLGGERRTVTVVCADVLGSAALLARRGTEEWAITVSTLLRALGAEVHRFAGEIERYLEHGLEASFGATAAHEDDPERGVLAALAMQRAFAASLVGLAEEEQGTEHLSELGLAVGVHTGEAIVAAVEVGDGQQGGAAMGEAVALAGRMQALAAAGEVRVSESTYRLVAPLFEWALPGDAGAEGKGYRPLAHRRLVDKGRGLPGMRSPLVGRVQESGALCGAIEDLQSGLGGIVTLVGEAGTGKSRLVAEAHEWATGRTPKPPVVDLEWVEGRCLSYATDTAYQVWLDMLRELLGAAPDAPRDAVCDALRQEVRTVCAERMDDVYPFLARMMSLPLEDDVGTRLRGLDAGGLKVLTFRAVETLVECAARRWPLVIVCEDLHWADPTSLELLEHLLPTTDRVPLLFICVFRPEMAHGCWRIKETAARLYHHRHTDLWLHPLSAAESETLVGNLLHREELPRNLREWILERAEGNPLFVEEILRSLIDEGVIVHDEVGGRWQVGRDVTEIAIPDTLHGVLMARIDRLPGGARRLLQLASVIGHIFSYRVLAAIAEKTGLDDHLVTLQRAQMIHERARVPEVEYVFRHVLTQAAAYEGLLRRARRTLRRRVAEAWERLYPERIEEQLGLLAHHWERAGQAEKAAAYLRRAGEQAAAQFANAEAVAYLSRALDLTPEGDMAERYALLLARERVRDLQGAREAQRQDLAALEALAEALADPGRQADVALRQVHLAFRTQDYEAAEEIAQATIRWAQDAQDVARQAAAHRELGRALRYRQEYHAARVELEQALLLARAAGSRQVEVDVLHELGASWTNLAEEIPYLVEQLRICREMGNRRDEGRALRDLGFSFLNRAKYRKAMAYFEESLQVCLETGNRRDEGWALHFLAWVYSELGDHTTARAYSEQALHVHNETGDRLGKAWACTVLCRAYAHAGDYAGARNWIVRAEGYEVVLAWVLGDLALVQGDHQRARNNYEAALRLSRAESPYRCGALCGLARIALAEGDLAQAQGYVAEILRGLGVFLWSGLFLGLTPYLVCYRVLRASGDSRAGEVLDETYRLLQERTNEIDDQALRRSYLENVTANREIIAAWEENS